MRLELKELKLQNIEYKQSLSDLRSNLNINENKIQHYEMQIANLEQQLHDCNIVLNEKVGEVEYQQQCLDDLYFENETLLSKLTALDEEKELMIQQTNRLKQ